MKTHRHAAIGVHAYAELQLCANRSDQSKLGIHNNHDDDPNGTHAGIGTQAGVIVFVVSTYHAMQGCHEIFRD